MANTESKVRNAKTPTHDIHATTSRQLAAIRFYRKGLPFAATNRAWPATCAIHASCLSATAEIISCKTKRQGMRCMGAKQQEKEKLDLYYRGAHR